MVRTYVETLRTVQRGGGSKGKGGGGWGKGGGGKGKDYLRVCAADSLTLD